SMDLPNSDARLKMAKYLFEHRDVLVWCLVKWRSLLTGLFLTDVPVQYELHMERCLRPDVQLFTSSTDLYVNPRNFWSPMEETEHMFGAMGSCPLDDTFPISALSNRDCVVMDIRVPRVEYYMNWIIRKCCGGKLLQHKSHDNVIDTTTSAAIILILLWPCDTESFRAKKN